jgi:hypothetical protein
MDAQKAVERMQTAMRSMTLSGVFCIDRSCQSAGSAESRPAHFKVKFENNQIKAVRVYFDPHCKSVMNQTPARLVVLLTDAHFKVTDPNGVSAERYRKAGGAFWDDGNVARVFPQNLGDKPFEIL